jgi:hypothetical protein
VRSLEFIGQIMRTLHKKIHQKMLPSPINFAARIQDSKKKIGIAF